MHCSRMTPPVLGLRHVIKKQQNDVQQEYNVGNAIQN